MKTFVLFLLVGLAGCGGGPKASPPAPISLLNNLIISFPIETVQISSSGTYYYEHTGPNCSSSGTWRDLNSGSSVGRACFRVLATTCAHNYVGLIVSYDYVISNNIVTASNERVNPTDCN